LTKTPLIYSFIFQLVGLGTLFGGPKPTKALRGNGTDHGILIICCTITDYSFFGTVLGIFGVAFVRALVALQNWTKK